MKMTRKRITGLLLIVSILSIGSIVYPKFGNPFDELWKRISDTEARVEELETKIEELEDVIKDISEPGFGIPDYDSGWQTLDIGARRWICTLNDTNVFIYMIGRFAYLTGFRIHQQNYASDDSYPPGWTYVKSDGAWWGITEYNLLWVERGIADTHWEEVRVLIWKLPPPS